MKPYFTPAFLKEAKDRLGSGLVGIINETHPLKRVGHIHEACCPFHEDKTPSFKVQDGKSGWHYHCFGGCRPEATGDVFTWLVHQRGMSFHDAVAYVADRVGLELPAVSPEQKQKHDRLERLRQIVATTARWFGNKLYYPCGAETLAYLNKERGIDDDQIKDFQLGYAPADYRSWQDFITDLTTQAGYDPADLIASGVFREDEKSGRPRPFFMNKLIFTIRDLQGRPIAFAGRRIGDGDGPKYINTQDCELFSKRRVVYNADRAAKQIARSSEQVKLVEGYTDVIAIEKAGLGPVVCCMGTAATSEQMETIWKFSANREMRNEPVLCFDGDAAGLNAAQVAAERFLPLVNSSRSVRFALLANAHDPASLLAQHGGDQVFGDAVHEAESAQMILYRREQAKLPDRPTPEDFAAFDAAVETKILKVIQDARLKQAYKDEFWRLKRERNGFKVPRREVPKTLPVMQRFLSEPALLAALLYHPTLFCEFGEDTCRRDMSSPEMEHCRDLIVSWMSNATDDLELRRQAEALIDQCEEIHTFVLTDAVFTAAPFVMPSASLEDARAGVQSILIDMQISSVKLEVARLMALLNGSDEDSRIMAQVSALLSGVRG